MMIGTGASLDFGLQTAAGAYTVIATNTSTTCTNVMTGSATVTLAPLPASYSVSGGGNYCSGGTGLHINLSGSDAGTNYQLFNGTTMAGAPVTGTGAPLDLGSQTAAGTYIVIATSAATCTRSMAGSAAIAIEPLPTTYTITGGGNYCAGGTGSHIMLSGSTPGTSYQLNNGGTATGAPITGTGAGIDFGLQTATGIYNVIAINTATGCTNNMTGSATVGIDPLPAAYVVTGAGTSYCAGGAGIDIALSGSSIGNNYQLYDGATTIGSAVAGSGSPLDFGHQTATGTYHVVAISTTTACTNTMTGAASVIINPLPTVYTVTGGGSYCYDGTGVHIGLSNSNAGVNYQLSNGLGMVGTPVSGTGTALDLGLQTAASAYTVVATNNATGCTNNMSGSATVSINALPTPFTVTGGGNYCTGGTGVHVSLGASTTGIVYKLMRGTIATASSPGTGIAIDFGLQTIAGTYTVTATNIATGCTGNMTGSVNVGTYPLPTAYTVTGGGDYCAGGTGVHVGLSSSASGITYQLYDGGTAEGLPVGGTGTAIDFGLQTITGAYFVKATSAATGCTNAMAGTVAVVIDPLPTVYTVTGGGNYCYGGAGVHVGLSNSAPAISYQLYNSFTASGSPVIGTGGPLDLGLQTAAGTYTIVATNTATACTQNMAGSTTVVVTPSVVPSVTIATGTGDTICSGHTVTLTAITANGGITPTYQWTINGAAIFAPGNTYTYIPANGDVIGVALTSDATCASPAIVNNAITLSVEDALTPVINISADPGNVVCKGTAVVLTAAASFGGASPTYSWIVDGSNVGSAATYAYTPANGDNIYCVMTSDYRCRLSNMATSNHIVMEVDSPVAPTVTIAANPGTNVSAGQNVILTVTVVNGGPSPAYQWMVNGSDVPGATSPVLSSDNYADNDVITCQVTGNSACSGLSGSASVTIHVSHVGVQQVVSVIGNITIVPNPSKGVFTVKGTLGSANEEVAIEVTDLLGQAIYNNKVIPVNGEINEEVQLGRNIANGMYLLNLHTATDHKVFHIVIEQ